MRDRSKELIEDIFPCGEVHSIAGSSGAGKTRFEVWMAWHIMQGLPFLNRPTHAPPWWGTLVIDRNAEARREAWEACGLKMDEEKTYCLTEDEEASPDILESLSDRQAEMAILDRGLKKLNPPPGGVLTIDVATIFTGDQRHGYHKGFGRGWKLGKIARKLRITILALMHGGKQKKVDTYLRSVDRTIANSGFLGAIGTKTYLCSPEETDGHDEDIQEYCWQSHHAPTEVFHIRRRRDSGLYEFVGQVHKGGIIDGAPQWCERWDSYLAWLPMEGSGESMTTEQIVMRAAQPGLKWPKRNVERDLSELKEKGFITLYQGVRGRWQRKQRVQLVEGGGE